MSLENRDSNSHVISSSGVDSEHQLVEAAPAPEVADEVQKLTEQRDALQDRLLRALAEADNARKRYARELQEARQQATADTVRPFLSVLDSFDRAQDHAASSSVDELRKGMDLLHRQLLDAVRKAGLEPIASQGQSFDPHLHEALELVETTDAPDGQIVEELQRGYKLRERLVRPAMVRVARRKG